jgi:4-methylaminobutanoate oxidase (formaldehyde-forming)
MKKNIPFRGREAIAEQKSSGVKKMLATFTIDDPEILLLGRETIFRNGERVGWLSSGGFGHTIGKSIGLGYVRDSNGVDEAYVLEGDYELEVATERVKCNVHLQPLYDPSMSKVKA